MAKRRNGKSKMPKIGSLKNRLYPFVKTVSAPIAFLEQITAKDRQDLGQSFTTAGYSTQLKIMGKDSELNTEFRIKWPRGLLGSLPADSEQFMLIEELYKQMDRVQLRVDSMLHNEVGIKALDKAVDKLQKDVEKLKDKQRDFANGEQQ